MNREEIGDVKISMLRIKTSKNLGLVPPVIGYLASIPENGLSYRFYRLRHPGGIFNTQFGSVTRDLLELTKYLNNLTLDEIRNNKWDSLELIRKFTLSLFSFTNYVNCAYEIILSCCPKTDNPPDVELWKWLKQNNYSAGTKYYATLSELRETLDTFNELKHSSTRFGFVSMQRLADSIDLTGYYVASADESGAISPNEKYHPKKYGEHTATSFSMRLRIMYYGIYKVADELLSALQFHFKEVYGKELDFAEERKEDSKLANELLEQINTLPLALFPYEGEKLIPIARIIRRGADEYLIFEKKKISTPVSGYNVTSGLPLADGFSRSWGIPYFKGK